MAGCDGPDGSKWDNYFGACAIGSQTSCDTVNQSTCYYAFINLSNPEGKSGWLSGKLIDGGLKVHSVPESLAKLCGIEVGDVIHTLNGSPVCEHSLSEYTEESPATFAEGFRYHASNVNQWRVDLQLSKAA